MHLRCHMEPYQEVEARGAWFSRCQEKSKCPVGGVYQIREAQLGDALHDEEFQVLRHIERRACHQIDDILVALRKNWISTVAVYRTDGGVRLYEEGPE